MPEPFSFLTERLELEQILAREIYRPRGRFVAIPTRQNMSERALAGATAPQNGYYIMVVSLEGNTLENFYVTEAFMDVLNFKCGFGFSHAIHILSSCPVFNSNPAAVSL